jgi:hypothetical protein
MVRWTDGQDAGLRRVRSVQEKIDLLYAHNNNGLTFFH